MKKIIGALAIIIVLVGIVAYAYYREGKSSAGAGGFRRGQMSIPVETKAVENGDIAKKILATGYITARAEVEVYPKQSGEVVELLVDKGDKVKAGQILAKIDSEAVEIQIRQFEADLASAKASYEKSSPLAAISSETDFKQAKSNLDRLKSVLKQAELDLELQEKQAIVKVKRAEADLRIAQARLEAAESGAREQELDQAKVRTENAKRELERLLELSADDMVSKDQVEAAQLQYDIYNAQLSLIIEGARPEDIEVLKAQLETANAALESAGNEKVLIDIKKSSMDAATAQMENAQASFDLASVANEASTWEQDLIKAESAVLRAQASLEMAQKNLNDSTIKAPTGGIIAQRLLDKGDAASPTRPFVTIVDMDVVKIPMRVEARYIADVRLGDQAIIKPSAYPGQEFIGKVVNVSPVIDKSSQTCDVEVEAANGDYRLKPGMFTRAELTTLKHKNVPIIPMDVVLDEEGETFVYGVNEGKAVKKVITTGIDDSIRVEVVSGLKAGDEYVIAGYHSLRPGMQVILAGAKPAGKPAEGGKGAR